MQLSSEAHKFEALGISIIGITYDSPAVLKKFTAKRDINFPMLSDAKSRVIRRLGLLNETMPEGTRYYGIPWPGIFLLDVDRNIQGKFAEKDYRERPLTDDLLTAARQMTAP